VSFEWPLALLALLLVPALAALYVARDRKRTAAAAKFASVALLPNVVDRAPGRRRYLPPALLLLALSAMLVGLARPHATVSVRREEATIVLAIDTSTSMTAKDVKPTRLVAAREAARAFLGGVPKKFRVGLVSFAGRSIAVVPPTEDREAVENGLKSLRPAIGTALGDAVTLAVNTARGSKTAGPAAPAAVLVISDGAQTVGRSQPVAAARRAGTLRTPVYTIVLGTPDGVIERKLVGGFTEITRVPPKPEALRAVAQASGGESFTAADADQLKKIYERLGSRLGTRKEDRELTDFFSAGAGLFLLAGVALSTLWFRRPL
jgi:Ca-activated chloride channel family protein